MRERSVFVNVGAALSRDFLSPDRSRLESRSHKPNSKSDFKVYKPDGLVKSILGRHPGEPRIMSGAGAGVQNILK